MALHVRRGREPVDPEHPGAQLLHVLRARLREPPHRNEKGTSDIFSRTGERISSTELVNGMRVTTYYGHDYGVPGGPAPIADYNGTSPPG